MFFAYRAVHPISCNFEPNCIIKKEWHIVIDCRLQWNGKNLWNDLFSWCNHIASCTRTTQMTTLNLYICISNMRSMRNFISTKLFFLLLHSFSITFLNGRSTSNSETVWNWMIPNLGYSIKSIFFSFGKKMSVISFLLNEIECQCTIGINVDLYNVDCNFLWWLIFDRFCNGIFLCNFWVISRILR